MAFLKKILPIFVSVFFFAGCLFDNEICVTLKNETDSSISFTNFNIDIDESLPVTLKSGKSINVSYSGMPESVDFKVIINGEEYSGTTNYVQDYSKYTLRIFMEENTLKCQAKNNEPYALIKTAN